MPSPAASYRVLELEGERDALERAVAELGERGCLGAFELAPLRWKAYFPATVVETELAAELRARVPELRARWLTPVPDRDWAGALRDCFRGLALGKSFYVVPSWESPPETSRLLLRIDPEQAFGTGSHESTRLAAEALERTALDGRRVIDVGTGSGVLAMVAARLGAASVLALEPDETAAECARRNVERNALAARIRVETAGFESYERLEADVIVANLYGALLERALPRFRAPRAILSGLLRGEVEGFIRGSIPETFRVVESATDRDWAALVLEMETRT